jgi:hypothetical protein
MSFNTPEDPMCEHCGSRVHVTLACKLPVAERQYAFRKPASPDTGYHYYVSVDDNLETHKDGSWHIGKETHVAREFTDSADAMAMWSAGITAGAEYVIIEALRGRDYEQPQ